MKDWVCSRGMVRIMKKEKKEETRIGWNNEVALKWKARSRWTCSRGQDKRLLVVLCGEDEEAT